MTSIDWGIGRYETTAARLEPAAHVAVERAHVRPGEPALDLGCGTGNAAVLLAQRGAEVIAVDPAARLLDVATQRAVAAALNIDFRQGEAGSLPLDDASVDLIVSVFAVVFAPDAAASMREMDRVLRMHGRVVLTAWVSDGPIARMGAVAGAAVREALGAPEPPRPFAWHERDAVTELAAPYGFAVDIDEHTITFTAPSPAAYVDAEGDEHPVALAGRTAVERAGGDAAALRERLIAVLEEGNEDPTAFRATSRYRVVTLTR